MESGFVSEASAERDYGVVIRKEVVDEDATARLRGAHTASEGFDGGRNRNLGRGLPRRTCPPAEPDAQPFTPPCAAAAGAAVYEDVVPELKSEGGFDIETMAGKAVALREGLPIRCGTRSTGGPRVTRRQVPAGGSASMSAAPSTISSPPKMARPARFL